MSDNNEPTPSPTPEPTPEPTPTLEPTPSPTPAPSLTDKVEAEPEPFVPLTADDLTIPEGLEVIDELRDEFLMVVNDQEMSPKDRANALVGLQEKVAKMAAEASSQAWDTMNTQWQDSVKADPEIGGAKLDETLGRIGKLIDEHGTPGLREALNITGAGNNPEVIKFFNKLAVVLTEGGPVSGAAPSNTEQTAASVMFPSMKG